MKNSKNLAHAIPPELTILLEKAAEFHGHLGPFLAIGVRMGIIGLKKIGKDNSDSLRINVSLPLHVPFSCIIDGLQVTTHCTVGNQKLSLHDSESVQTRFKRDTDKMEVIVTLNKPLFEELKSQLLGEAVPEKEVRKLARVIAGISEDELFVIS